MPDEQQRTTSGTTPEIEVVPQYIRGDFPEGNDANVVGVVGSDYPMSKLAALSARGVDLGGLEQAEGEYLADSDARARRRERSASS